MLRFGAMNEAALRQWVEANPGRVNDFDDQWYAPLHVAAIYLSSLELVIWLVDVKGANVDRQSVLCRPDALDIFNFLLDRGADPTLSDYGGRSPLMLFSENARGAQVRRLLQDPRV